MGVESLSFSYAHQVLLFASGQGWQSYLHWPPGYSLSALAIHLFGLTPLRSLWIISLISYTCSAGLIFLLARRWTDGRKALIAVALFALNPVMLRWANQAMTEMIFMAVSLLTFYALERVYFRAAALPRGGSFLAGCLLALPYWMRNIGLISVALGFIGLLSAFIYYKQKRRAVLVTGMMTLLTMLPLLLRNLLYKSNLTGHGLGNQPRADFMSALLDSLRLTWQAWMPLPETCKPWLAHSSLALALLLLIGLAAFFSSKRCFAGLLASYSMMYLLAFAYAYSHTRIDLLNDRFIVPIIPFLCLSLVLVWYEIERLPNIQAVVKKGMYLLIGVSTVFIAARGGQAMIKGFPDLADRLSIQTIRYFLQHANKGTTYAGNRNQIQAYSLDYPFYQIPGNRPEDADYMRGRRITWTRASAIRFWLEKDIRFVILFSGVNRDDPLLEARAYGSYVDSMRTVPLPEIASAIDLADGKVLHLADPQVLQDCLHKRERAR